MALPTELPVLFTFLLVGKCTEVKGSKVVRVTDAVSLTACPVLSYGDESASEGLNLRGGSPASSEEDLPETADMQLAGPQTFTLF